MHKKTVTLIARFSGKVQKVNFRSFVKQSALSLNISGGVRNLDDGNVEMIAVGEIAVLEKLLQYLQANFTRGHIDKISAQYLNEKREFEGFSIWR